MTLPRIATGACPPDAQRYTCFARWPGLFPDIEEIDVDAHDPFSAKVLAEWALLEHYIPGGYVFYVEQRTGVYL